MCVSYKKLWILLAEKGMTKADLRRAADIDPAILTKLNKNEFVSMIMLAKICDALDCDFGDIIEYIKE